MVGQLKGTGTVVCQERKHDGGDDGPVPEPIPLTGQVLVLHSVFMNNIKLFSIYVGVFISDYHYLMGGWSKAFIKELHGSHVGCACNDNDCNDSIICIYYHEQKISDRQWYFEDTCYTRHEKEATPP